MTTRCEVEVRAHLTLTTEATTPLSPIGVTVATEPGAVTPRHGGEMVSMSLASHSVSCVYGKVTDMSNGEHYGRTANGELIGPYDTVVELSAELAASDSDSGYTYCACRDCMDVSISTHIHTPELCLLCKGAGCEPNNGDCERDDAYGNE